ncbi:MAG: VWA domain-containing protein, partial [Thermoplasmata archaeon]|nr:VWA domain-containing protein [Thermoplasmata archaeon]
MKNGDQIRVTARALDYKIIISDKVTQKPLDVVLVLDNSGSMSGTPWVDLENAATTFIDTLAENDRCAIIAFDRQAGWPLESVKQYSEYMYMDQTYNDPQGTSYTSTGRNVSKYIITTDDGLHLTNAAGNPWSNTPIWDTLGTGIQYAINSRRTDAVPVVIAITDGGDYGSRGWEHGSETYCPGAPNGATGQTWAVSGGCIWNSPDRAYSSIQRELDTIQFNALTTVSFFSGSPESTRTGLLNATVPVFTIGLSISPQGSNASASGYLPPTASSYKYTTEFDLLSIANTSVSGRYYFAPNSNQLIQIYNNVSQVIQKYGVTTLGLTQPNGISSVQADFSSIGVSLKVNMFDDGKHGDAKAGDDIYGSDLIAVNSLDSGTIVFQVEGTDKAGNVNNTQFTILLDNTQPFVSSVNTTYPANRTKAQDGYSIYVVANCSDAETGLSNV